MDNALEGLRILVLEDEFLIAMDVEELCRERGAAEVTVARDLSEVDADTIASAIDAAVLDVMLGGTSTLDFAKSLRQRGVPFVFASGYTDLAELHAEFPGVVLVAKPYMGAELTNALAAAAGRRGNGPA